MQRPTSTTTTTFTLSLLRPIVPVLSFPFAVFLLLLCLGTSASATTIVLSDLASSEGTALLNPIPKELLDAEFEYLVSGSTLTFTVTNTTVAPATLDINALFFSGTDNVTGLLLNSATHSVEGDVLADWTLNTSTGDGGPTHGNGFGIHDFSLTDGVGLGLGIIGPLESVVFDLTISGTGSFSPTNFIDTLSQQTLGGDNILTRAVAKFVNGNDAFFGTDFDSAYGASTPEPSTFVLAGLGLLALGLTRLRRYRRRI